MTSLVKVSLNFQMFIAQTYLKYVSIFVEKIWEAFALLFPTKTISEFGYKIIKHLTSWPFNELVKLTMLWITGSRSSLFPQAYEWKKKTTSKHISLWKALQPSFFTFKNDKMWVGVHISSHITTGWERTVHVSRCPALYSGRSLSHYVGNWLFLCFKIIKCWSCNLAFSVR